MVNMIGDCSISKQAKLDDGQGRDRLSDLPLGIIHIILAFIPIRETVRTSVLSKEWRYTWTTLPHLDFDYECVSREKKEANRCEDFITQVLFHHKGPIHKCRIYCPDNCRNLDEWVLRLSRNDIQELILVLPYDELPWAAEMHSSIYSCKKLTYLRLYGCKLDPPPLTFKGFLFLRGLSLSRVGLSADAIYSLVASCPLLESFELNDEESELKISAPNLKCMRLEGGQGKISINAPLMTDLSVVMNYFLDVTEEQLKSSACDYAKCIGGFINLQKLFGFGLFTQYLSHGIELSHPSLVFHHLKLIDLDVDFEDVKQILVVGHLVIGAPNLQKLKIVAEFSSREDDESVLEAPLLSYLGCPSNFKLEKLTDVHVDGFANEVEFLKFLLESSPSLETMSLALLGDSEEKRNNMRAKLKGCHWASPTAKLCFFRHRFSST